MPEALSLSAAPSSALSVRLGLVVWVPKGKTPEAIVRRVSQLGFSTCQIGFEALDLSFAPALKNALSTYGVEATALLELGPGRRVWNFYEGPLTID